MMLKLMITIITTKIMLTNKGNREEKRRVLDRAIMFSYSTVTSEISNVVIFTNHLLSAYILHQAKIQHYVKAELLLTV